MIKSSLKSLSLVSILASSFYLLASPIQAGSITLSPSGTLTIRSSVLGVNTQQSEKEQVKQQAKEEVRTITTDAKAVELKATQENKIRVSTEPTDKTAAMPLAEEDDVLFTQKVATQEAKVRITSRDQNKYMMTEGYSVKVGTPLSYNLETNEMTVTTPAGTKTVTVLPDEAFKQAKLSADTTKDNMELVDYQNSPTYTVSGIANKKVFGLFPVSFDKKVYVSAISGNVVNTETSGINKLLDLISF